MIAFVNVMLSRLAAVSYGRLVSGAARGKHVRLTPVWAYPIVERNAD
ncbi:MAG TPA: hypothetical protein VFO41_17010 [Alphaproteobacteria bacterium]|nr:hypothetical protein [Alphaproteobacteria bacterium]